MDYVAMTHADSGDVAVVPASAYEAHWSKNGWKKVAAKDAEDALAAAEVRRYDPEASYDAKAYSRVTEAAVEAAKATATTDKSKG